MILNSEAWVNLSYNNIRSLEQIDEALLSKILECNGNTSNAMKYLELGVYPIRYELRKRKILYLQYILKQEKSSMMYQVLKATCDNPTKNDFVKTCQQYLDDLDIKLSFQEIENMSKWTFKKLVLEKTKEAGLKYLIGQKAQQTKTSNIHYEDLMIQEYFIDGNCKKNISKLIFKARSKTLDIKTQQKWKYADKICIGCKTKEESGDEILVCENLNKENGDSETPINYNWFYKNTVRDIVKAGLLLDRGLKERDKIVESGVT